MIYYLKEIFIDEGFSKKWTDFINSSYLTNSILLEIESPSTDNT